MAKNINELIGKIKFIKEKYEWNSDFLSRWKFENCLDSIALEIHNFCHSYIEKKKTNNNLQIGCSIIYLGDPSNYYVGGSSIKKIKMDPSSRFYECPRLDDKSFESFTMCSAVSNVSLVLDDFCSGKKKFSNITHKEKVCELDESKTQSFYCIPSFTNRSNTPKKVRSQKDYLTNRQIIDEYPSGILRMSFSEKNIASIVDSLFNDDFFIFLFEIIKTGQIIVSGKDKNKALAIADLQSDLLKYRNSEYTALSQLTSHLQTLFGNCECSIFLAHKKKHKKGIDVLLYLSATTAQSDSKQHEIFRYTFFNKNKHYKCYFDRNGNPKTEYYSKCGKTEIAYYKKNEAFLREKDTISSKFHGQGEFSPCAAFLAVAIPSPESFNETMNQLPYGVIRIVRKIEGALDESDRRLATAIARALTYWVDFFPKNEELIINWSSDKLKAHVSRVLFNIGKFPKKNNRLFAKANNEITFLLQKIFHNCKVIHIQRLFSGRSGAVILLVKNDNGLDLILKCSSKIDTPSDQKNDILLEIENYERFIQGKLELNHNIIYKELVRETYSLVGFATSFLGTKNKNRISMTDYFSNKENRENDRDLGLTFTRIADKIVNGVWSWWYDGARLKKKNNKVDEYIKLIINEDSYFGFFHHMKYFDSKVFSPIFNILRFDKKPSDIWNLFFNWMQSCKNAKNINWFLTATHGDLHGDNIFFDPQTMDMWIIDFARTNKRTSVFDLATIESDIKFRHIPNIIADSKIIEDANYISNYWEFECDLAKQKLYEELIIPKAGIYKELKIASKAITNIRQIAAQRLERRGRFDDYMLLLFLLSFKYMKIINDNTRKILPYISSLAIVKNIVFASCNECDKVEGGNKCKFPDNKTYREIFDELDM